MFFFSPVIHVICHLVFSNSKVCIIDYWPGYGSHGVGINGLTNKSMTDVNKGLAAIVELVEQYSAYSPYYIIHFYCMICAEMRYVGISFGWHVCHVLRCRGLD